MPEFAYQDPFPLGPDPTRYRHLSSDFVSTATFEGQEILKVAPEALAALAREAFRDVSFLYRERAPREGRRDPRRSRGLGQRPRGRPRPAQERRRGLGLPAADVPGHRHGHDRRQERPAGLDRRRGRGVALPGDLRDLPEGEPALLPDRPALDVRGDQLRDEPAGPDRHLWPRTGGTYEFLFVAKGGGSANKSMLFQETKALLNPASLEKFLDQKLRSLGTAACPPYHLAVVIGGTSAEATMKTVKLASTGYLDHLPTEGNRLGRAFRDPELEEKVMELARQSGIGAQFGGKYFALDARVIRLPRHGASCPVGIGVSCSADRNIKARIDRDGLWLEELERNPARFIPASIAAGSGPSTG